MNSKINNKKIIIIKNKIVMNLQNISKRKIKFKINMKINQIIKIKQKINTKKILKKEKW